MPVRIVKDNPDEMVVSDNFNFDNPQNQVKGNQGGGIDLSFLNELLGGGGQKGGGSILDLLGGGGQGGGSILDLLGGGQTNQGGGGILGGLINSFLGGQGSNKQQVNRGGGVSSNNTNSLLSVLGSMAVNACINYAINSFMNKGGGRSFSKGAPPSKKDIDDLLNERLNSAEVCVSLWSHTVFADQELQAEEEKILEQLISETLNQLFPPSIANQTEVYQILMDRVHNPLDYDTIVGLARQDYNFAGQLYQQTCLLIAADKILGGGEDDYIHNLASDLGLQQSDAQTIRQKFGL